MRKIKINYTKEALLLNILLTLFIVSIFCFVFFCQNVVLKWFVDDAYYNALFGEFQICFLNVGQGDSTFVRYKDTTFIIDAGDDDAGKNLATTIDEINYDDNVDYFILTHPDSDHTGGAEEIFEKFKVENFIRPKMLTSEEEKQYGNEHNYGVYDTIAYNDAIEAGYKEGCNIMFVDAYTILETNDFSFKILYPFSDDDLIESDTNSYSAIIRIEDKGFTYLLMADADESTESKLASKYKENLKCNVLKASHHGSKYGTTDLLLAYSSPSYVIVSVGEKGISEYGHAGEEFKERVRDFGATIYQTNEYGNIMFSGGDDSNLVTFNTPAKIEIALVSVICTILILLVWGVTIKREKKEDK